MLFSARQAKTVLDHRIYLEYEEVLLRPEFGFSRELVDDLLDFLWLSSERVRVATMSVELPDADDTKFLEVAMTASADFLITGNLRHFPARQRHGVHVVSPREWWELWSEHPS